MAADERKPMPLNVLAGLFFASLAALGLLLGLTYVFLNDETPPYPQQPHVPAIPKSGGQANICDNVIWTDYQHDICWVVNVGVIPCDIARRCVHF